MITKSTDVCTLLHVNDFLMAWFANVVSYILSKNTDVYMKTKPVAWFVSEYNGIPSPVGWRVNAKQSTHWNQFHGDTTSVLVMSNSS